MTNKDNGDRGREFVKSVLKFCADIEREIDFNLRNGFDVTVNQLLSLEQAIAQELNRLPITEREILYSFYVEGLRWVQIARRVNYSVTVCKDIRNRGLDKLANHFFQNAIIADYNYPE